METLLDFKCVYFQGPYRTSHLLMVQNGVVPREKNFPKENSLESFTVLL